MKSTFKRVISVLLAAALFLSASPVVELSEFDFLSFKASAASYKGTCGDNLEWELDISYGVLTITGTGDMTVWAQKENVPWRRHVSIIKSVVIENGVTNIGAHAFSDCKYIKSISISDTVININATFNTCTALSAITVAENNTVFSSDEYGVLFNKDKTRVIRCPIANPMANYTVPESVTGIDGFAFYQCANLESIALSDAVTSIGGNAFTGTAFYNNSENWENGTLYIGNHLIYVDNKFSGELVLKGSTLTFAQYAVSGCYYITAIRIDGESEIYSTDEYGVLFNKDKTELIKYPPASTAESWHMPLSVKRIASEALSSTDNLTSLYYDGTYEQWNNMDIQQYFYFDTSKIVFECNSERPYRLSDLTSSIEWKLYTDGELVISGTGEMYDYYDYSDIEYIPWYDYSYSVKKIVICDGITYIGDNAFAYCSNATSVSIPASVTQMGNSPFYYCNKIEHFFVDENSEYFTTDENKVLFSKDKTRLIRYSSCCDAESYIVPETVTTIETYAFQSSLNLKEITLGVAVQNIKGYAFSYCINLEAVYYSGTLKDWQKINVNSYGNSYLTDNLILDSYGEKPYKYSGTCGNSTSWIITEDGELIISGTGKMDDWIGVLYVPWYSYRNFIKAVTVEDGVENIGNNAFNGFSNIERVSLPNSLRDIGECSFENCDALEIAEIPYGVSTINYRAFCDCDGIKSVDISDSVTHLGNYSFYDCDGIESFVIPDSVTYLGEHAFYSCDSLETVSIGDSLKNIGMSAFEKCYNLVTITFGKSVEIIDHYAFYFCTKLSNIILPDSLISIADSAFAYCQSIETVAIPANVHMIGYMAFACCDSLASITVDENNMDFASDEYGVLYDKFKYVLIQYPIANERSSYSVAESVLLIRGYSFTGCTSLEEITIEKSVTSIGEDAFSGCSNLRDVYFGGIKEKWNTIDIGEQNEPLQNATIHFIEPMFVVSDEIVHPGEIAEVEVLIRNNPGLSSAKLNISYNSNVLTLWKISEEGLLGAGYFNTVTDNSTGTVTAVWSGETVNYKTDGVLLTLTFKVSDDALTGDVPITVEYEKESVVNKDLGPIEAKTQSGTVSVKDRISGDANGDGIINLKDVIIIERYLAGGFDVEPDLSNADVNGDGTVNLIDTVIMKRYLSAWDVVLI